MPDLRRKGAPDGLWSAMKYGITMMTVSVRLSPGSSRHALHAMKSNTWVSASYGVKRTKRWLIWRSPTAGPFTSARIGYVDDVFEI